MSVEEIIIRDPIVALQQDGEEIIMQLTLLRGKVKDLEAQMKIYVKDVSKMVSKKGGRKPRAERKSPSGFAKKTKVTDVMEKFMKDGEVVKIVDGIKSENATFEGLDANGMMSRPSATKIVNAYIRAKGLQDPNSKKNFKPDAKLKKILTPLTPEDTAKGGYSFFNLQRYMAHLYVKN